MSRRANIDKLIDQLEANARVKIEQDGKIARIIHFYEGIVEGLTDKVPNESLHQVAAALTAGYWASPD